MGKLINYTHAERVSYFGSMIITNPNQFLKECLIWRCLTKTNQMELISNHVEINFFHGVRVLGTHEDELCACAMQMFKETFLPFFPNEDMLCVCLEFLDLF